MELFNFFFALFVYILFDISIHDTFCLSFCLHAFDRVLSSCQGRSGNRDEAKQTAERTRLGKGSSQFTVFFS